MLSKSMNLYFHHQWLMRNPRLRSPLPQFVPMLDGIGILVQGHVQVGDGQVGLVERAVIIAQHIAEALVGFGQGLHAAQGRADRAADAMDAATTDYAAALSDLVDAMDGYTDATATDADDLIQTAALSLWQSIVSDSPDGQTAPDTAFLAACSAVNKAIYAERSNTGTLVRVKQDAAGNVLRSDEYKYTRLPHLYVDHLETDDNGELTADIVDVSDALAAYQRGQGMRDDIQTALAALEAKDRQVLVWHAQGATYETIARRMRTTVPAIKMRVKRAREKARAALEKSI